MPSHGWSRRLESNMLINMRDDMRSHPRIECYTNLAITDDPGLFTIGPTITLTYEVEDPVRSM